MEHEAGGEAEVGPKLKITCWCDREVKKAREERDGVEKNPSQ